MWKKCLLLCISFIGVAVGAGCDNSSSANVLSGLLSQGRSQLSQVRYWGYQIQDLDSPGAVDDIVNSRYDMVVIEPTVTYEYGFDARGMVQRIKASKANDGVSNKLVMAYIDIGQVEEWRWYWADYPMYEDRGPCRDEYIAEIQQFAPWVVACDPDGWGGNYPVAYWTEEWKDIVIYGTSLGPALSFNSILDEVVQDGFDGVYLDWVEAWEMPEVQARAASEGKDPAQEIVDLIQEIRQYGLQHNSDFVVIQQNSADLIFEVGAGVLDNTVDAIAQEGVWWEGVAIDDWNDPSGYDIPSVTTNFYLPRLQQYKAAGFPVFVCEYAVNNAADAYAKADAEGFIAYTTRRALSQLSTTPPDF